MNISEEQYERLFATFVNTIIEKCAKELDVTSDFLKMRYMDDKVVKETIDVIIDRHIKLI
jgi:hypothetical protein